MTVEPGQSTGPLRAAEQPPRLLRGLLGQFGRPSGALGRLAGQLMARGDEDDRWIVELLDVQPDDRVLDVGFGPGVAVQLIAERATSGLVAGVDPSDVMVQQATHRNEAAAKAGRVDLRRGTVQYLPYPDGFFTKACALHSVYFWQSLEKGLRELRRALAIDAILVLAVRMRRAGAGRLDPSRYGLTDEQVASIQRTLESLGYRDVSTRQRRFPRETVTAIIGRC